MAETLIPYRFLVRGGTAAAVAALNEVVKARELVFETDTRKFKIGDGSSTYNSLPYIGELANLPAPGADRMVFWDHSAGAYAYLTPGTNLSITGTTLNASGGGGGGGFPRTEASFPFRGAWGRVQYVPNASTSTVIGINTTLVTVQGTFAAVNRANTNSYTRQPRGVFTSAAGAGSAAGFYNNTNVFSDTGGYHFATRFGFADASTVANARAFVGVRAATAAPANSNPSSWTDIVGIGYDTGDANLQLIHNDSAGVATKTDLGASFPANTLSADLYEVQFESAPGSGQVQWHILNTRTGDTDTGTVTTDLPATGTDLGPIVWRNNGTTALAVKLELTGWLLAYSLEG